VKVFRSAAPRTWKMELTEENTKEGLHMRWIQRLINDLIHWQNPNRSRPERQVFHRVLIRSLPGKHHALAPSQDTPFVT
jgi:hypothetical protein